MLGEIEARVGLFAITAKPQSRWRRWSLDFLPYIQGQKVGFSIVVTALGDLLADSNLTYTVENPGGLLSHRHVIKQPAMRKGQKATWESEKIPLYRTGDSLFTVWEGDSMRFRQGAFMFHTTSRNTVFLTALGIVVTALVAIITIA